MIGLSLVDPNPMRPGWGRIWQGSELSALFDTLPKPRFVVSLISESEPFISGSLTVFLADNDMTTLEDKELLASVECVLAWLRYGREILIHCFQGKYRSTYLDVAVHLAAMNYSVEQAFEYVKVAHPIAELRAGTQAQLKRLEPTLRTLCP